MAPHPDILWCGGEEDSLVLVEVGKELVQGGRQGAVHALSLILISEKESKVMYHFSECFLGSPIAAHNSL